MWPFGKRDRTNDEYEQLLAQSLEGLKTMTAAQQSLWHFGEEERWDFSQDDGRLIFNFADGTVAEANAQIIGSLNTLDNTWMWGWANSSIEDFLKQDSIALREFGRARRIDQLTLPKRPATEQDGWHMAALACRLCNRQGAYRAPSGHTLVFMTFGVVKINKSRV